MNNQVNSEVLKLVNALRIDIAKLKMDQALGKLSHPNAIYKKRKEMARLLAGNGVVVAPAEPAKAAKSSKKTKTKEKKEEKK